MTKRSFYEDDEYIVTKPGTNTEISPQLKEKESIHGEVSFVDGMVIRSFPILEDYTNSIRHYLYDKLSIYEAELNTLKSSFNNEFNNFKIEINEIINEPILPNLIYILTLSLSGSILVRRRNILMRFFSPLIFGGVGLWYFMPNTFNSIGKKYNQFELNYLPNDVHIKRNEINENFKILNNQIQNGIEIGQKSVVQAVHDFRKTVQEVWE